MTDQTDAARAERNRRARERRADERYTVEYAARIREHVTGERSANQERVLAEADAIERKREQRNADARERRIRTRQQREHAQRRAEYDAIYAAQRQAEQDAEQRRREQQRAERDRIHAEQEADIERLRLEMITAGPSDRAAASCRYRAARCFVAAERNPHHAQRSLRHGWNWMRRAAEQDPTPPAGPDDANSDSRPAMISDVPQTRYTPQIKTGRCQECQAAGNVYSAAPREWLCLDCQRRARQQRAPRLD